MSAFFISKNTDVRLIDINKNMEIWFQHLNNYSVFYKTPLQLLSNQFLIKKLTPHDSCLVGVTCGEMFNIFVTQGKKIKRPTNSEGNNQSHCYSLISIDRRGVVAYEGHNGEVEHVNSVLDLAQQEQTIVNFSSIDAFYIGFLAGIELYKIKNNLKPKSKSKPALRLVYSRTG